MLEAQVDLWRDLPSGFNANPQLTGNHTTSTRTRLSKIWRSRLVCLRIIECASYLLIPVLGGGLCRSWRLMRWQQNVTVPFRKAARVGSGHRLRLNRIGLRLMGSRGQPRVGRGTCVVSPGLSYSIHCPSQCGLLTATPTFHGIENPVGEDPEREPVAAQDTV